jgi:predicted nuclease of predicted toxin-antitoxin system
MALSLYMDVHVPSAITDQLRLRWVDVLTAQEDGRRKLSDPDLLDRASELDRIFFTQDFGLPREASLRQRMGGDFVGVVYAHQIRVTVRQCVEDLELIAKAGKPAKWINRVEYLPLK